MRISKNQLPAKVTKELCQTLHQILAAANTPEEVEQILSELLSETEKVAVIKRMEIGFSLSRHESYEVIHKKLNVDRKSVV